MPPAPTLDEVVARLLDGARRPAAVVTDLDVRVDAPATVVRRVGEPLPDGQVRTVLLVTSDTETLRTDASRVGNLRWARMVGCVVADSKAAITLRPHPSWPPLADLDARLEGGLGSTRLDFAARLEVAPVLMAFARDAAAPAVTGPGGLRVAGDVVPPADPTYAVTYDVEDERPADVLITTPPRDLAVDVPESPVLGRAPLAVPTADAGTPLDEAVYNPTGFRRTWTRGMVDLAADVRLTPSVVRGLRDAQGVRLAPGADPRLVAGLAMSGIPTEQFDDPDQRERHSVRTRRAALLAHSTIAWRARLAERVGMRFELFPSEVALTTEAPDEVTDLLLARRYSGADLVVMPHAADGVDTECFVATPPDGVTVHARGQSPARIVASGGLIYVTHARSVL
ncbi:hypothetical protein BH09ACT12_BH09ACT12_22260 [soil metagenome]